MPGDWSPSEVAATVADYLSMLEAELRGEAYNKKEHNRRLQALLANRSAGAIEFKHQNISAVMIELGLPYIDGYKPRGNYQELLREEVVIRLSMAPEVERIAEAVVDAPVEAVPIERAPSEVFVDAPKRERAAGAFERRVLPTIARKINYLERETRNRSLGSAGELFVLDIEHKRLWESGARRLAERIEHVSVTQGDGLGYDIVSFDTGGRERFIEVKTTAFGVMTPFFASAKEVTVSETLPEFQLYRVFKFRDEPRIFTLPGSLRLSCMLEPVQFRASVA